MSKEEGLLEFLAHQVGANYISDLRKTEFRDSLVSAIEKVESSIYTVGEWSDVLDYLAGTKVDIHSQEEGKEMLLGAL